MGNLVFQATLGGQVNLVGPNTASTFNLNVPAIAGTLVTTGDTGTVTNTMCATSVYTAPGTIGSGTPNTGAFTTLSASGVATISAGSASAPALTTSGDTNTGTFFPAANNIAWTTDGTERLRLDASGNLGLGVTPSAWESSYSVLDIGTNGSVYNYANGSMVVANNLYVTGGVFKYKISSYAPNLYAQAAGQHLWYYAASGTAGNTATLTQAMTLDASGNLGVGTTSPSVRLHLYGAQNEMLRLDTTSTSYDAAIRIFQNGTQITNLQGGVGVTGGGTLLSTITNAPLVFGTNNAERARIDSSGNLLVGTTGVPNGTSIYGSAFTPISFGRSRLSMASSSTASLELVQFFNPNGQVGNISTSGSSTAYTTSSDYRLKNTVQPMTGALARVTALKPVTYKWNADGSDGEGFIAHELAEVCPDAVHGEKDAVNEDGNPVYQAIDTSFLVATLTAAIQELNAKFEAYKATHP